MTETIRQIDDLLGMQACNLQNLPENYTMRYCAGQRISSPPWIDDCQETQTSTTPCPGLRYHMSPRIPREESWVTSWQKCMALPFTAFFLPLISSTTASAFQGRRCGTRRSAPRPRHVHLCIEVLPPARISEKADGPISSVTIRLSKRDRVL